jgi:hypothetical protein
LASKLPTLSVAYDPGLERGLLPQQLGHGFQLRAGFGLQLGLAGVEEQAAERHPALGRQPGLQGRRIHRDLAAGHGLGLDDGQVGGDLSVWGFTASEL